MSTQWLCHNPIPDPTRLADPNRVQGARTYVETFYLLNQTLIYPSLIIYQHIVYKSPKYNYHRSGVYSTIYTVRSPIYIFKNYAFTFTDQSMEPTVMNPYSCFGLPECGMSLSLSSLPTRIKNLYQALRLVGNIGNMHIHSYNKCIKITNIRNCMHSYHDLYKYLCL